MEEKRNTPRNTRLSWRTWALTLSVLLISIISVFWSRQFARTDYSNSGTEGLSARLWWSDVKAEQIDFTKSIISMATQNEAPEALPPTLSTNDQDKLGPVKHSIAVGLREYIKPLYSRGHRIGIASSCISKALQRRHEQQRTDVRAADSSEGDWDWNLPLRPKLRWTKLLLIYTIHLERAAPSAFATIRREDFNISDDVYSRAISSPLKPLSNLGLSGSAFFHTTESSPNANGNAGLIVKSINRAFEYEFLHEQLLPSYIKYLEETKGPNSLLSRITDVLWGADRSLGDFMGIRPKHYMILVDILGDLSVIGGAKKWDLKPSGFFEPTRDLVPDAIKSEATKAGLAGTLDADVRIKLSRSQYESLKGIVERDTKFLESLDVVDYSFLLGRFPASSRPSPTIGSTTLSSTIADRVIPPGVKHTVQGFLANPSPTGDDFTNGILSADGQWIYRMTIVDFLWNVKKLVPTVMRTAGKILPDQTITSEPTKYRKAFLEMIDEYVEVVEV